jgi:hypothetical protein
VIILWLSNVEESFIIKFCVAHVVTKYFLTHNHAMLLDMAGEVVSGSSFFISYVQVASDSILDIFKFNVSKHHMMTSSNECISERILLIIEHNSGSICELAHLLAADLEVNRVQVSFDGEIGVSIESVGVVGTLQQQVADRWMVRHLLYIDHRTVRKARLVSFSQDRVQWLAPIVAREQESNACCHHKLHSLDRVVRGCGCGQQGSFWPTHRPVYLENGLWSHAPDGKTCACEIELSCDEGSTNLGQKMLEGISKFGDRLLIVEWETTIFPSSFMSIVVVAVDWGPVFGFEAVVFNLSKLR